MQRLERGRNPFVDAKHLQLLSCTKAAGSDTRSFLIKSYSMKFGIRSKQTNFMAT
jgi:hypothetical protein